MKETEILGAFGCAAHVSVHNGRVRMEVTDHDCCPMDTWDGSAEQTRALIEALEKAEQEVKKNLTVKKDQL